MSDRTPDVSRRSFMRTAAAGAGVAGATGTAAAAEDGEGGEDGGAGGDGGSAPEPDYDGYLNDVSNFSDTVDMRGQDEVTVVVGAEGNTGSFAFEPAAIHIDAGTTVVWEWNGKGGSHNVVHEEGDFESDLTAEEGFTFEQEFGEDGMWKYFCQPHKGLGMKGAVVVGTDYPSVSTPAAGSGPQQLPDSAKTLGIATSFVMLVTLGLAYVFIKYGGDYNGFEE